MEKQQLLNYLKNYFPEEIIKAFKKVPRENFLPENLKDLAYEDTALPLGYGATISQPYTIAFMLSLLELKKGQKILEIGSGCGYVLALLAEITKSKIYGIEIIKPLAEQSKKTLKKYKNIKVFCKNGFSGFPEKAPFDRILVSASANTFPEHLYSQLKPNGIIVVPVRDSIFQIKKQNGKIKIKEFPGFVFVNLVNE
ncbi:protein-L-isoaspartate O-methyltransferase [Candidatus Pacearchaeota archaeon]|nr:protein-L-isoaspartate O-methyltransferase [Candidatus Pacearchaeota archaeon]